MHKSSNESLIKALYIIADEVEVFGGFTQSTALREAATRIEDQALIIAHHEKTTNLIQDELLK